MSWKSRIGRAVRRAEKRLDRTRHRVLRATVGDRPARVQPYRSFGTRERVYIMARILHGPRPAPATPHDSWWRNLRGAYRRLESDEAPRARVAVRTPGGRHEATANDEGHVRLELETGLPAEDDDWRTVRVELLEPGGEGADIPVLIPDDPRFGVISDLDDTVLQTDVRHTVRMVREVLFGNAHTRIPFPGVSAFYRALHAGRNPLFYVSSSPWNLYDVLAQFLALHDIPAGPMVLRDWGIPSREAEGGHHGHKRAAIDRILETYPELPFILVGDSGQEDPEIYRSVVHDFPGRVLGIYIRNVHPDPGRVEAVRDLGRELAPHDIPLVLVDDTLTAARHAAERGWIEGTSVEEVEEGRRREARD